MNEQTKQLQRMYQACKDWLKIAEDASGETVTPGIQALAEMGFEAGWLWRDDEIAELKAKLAAAGVPE